MLRYDLQWKFAKVTKTQNFRHTKISYNRWQGDSSPTLAREVYWYKNLQSLVNYWTTEVFWLSVVMFFFYQTILSTSIHYFIPAFLKITKLLMEEKHWSCYFHPCSCCRMCLKHFFHQLLATPPNHSNSGWCHQLIEMNIKLNKEINLSSKWVFLLVLLISIEQSWRFLLGNWIIINSFSSS